MKNLLAALLILMGMTVLLTSCLKSTVSINHRFLLDTDTNNELDAMSYKKNSKDKPKDVSKGLKLALIGGVLMSFFYFLVQQFMSLNFQLPEVGKFTPYSAFFVFSIGILLSNLVFNTILMRKPVDGDPVSYRDYFAGNFKVYLVGILGGAIWCVGMAYSIIASEQAGPAISYGLGQGATIVAAFWGVFCGENLKVLQQVPKPCLKVCLPAL